MSDPEQIERLERRLQRERAARLAAEAIAEKGTRELYESAERLRLLETVAVAANLGRTPWEVLQLTVEHVCDYTGWPLGHVYFAGERKPVLLPGKIWFGGEAEQSRAFRELSDASIFRSGVGLPGRVMAEGKPAWIYDLASDTNFPRREAALRCGLTSAFAFPVLVGDRTAAVLEFFAYKPSEPDEAFLRAMAQIGVQLGRVIERDRAQTKVKAANGKLRRSIREAERQKHAAEAASRAKTAFLAVTSHEVRTPLNAVLGLTEALAREPLTAGQRQLVDGVRESGAMLLRLLDAVLDLSRIESGKMSVDLTAFDPRETLETVVRVWRPRTEQMGLTLATDLSGLPEGYAISSDKGKVEQTLVNLLSNALKFSPRGGEVQVSGRRVQCEGRTSVRIEVLDQGPGVPPQDRSRIFQPFEQTRSGREAGGAGLGLSICAGNIAALGGAIGHDTADGGETRFWFEFPAVECELPAPPTMADTPRDPEDFERAIRVLAAEDNATNRQVLKVLLDPLPVDLTMVEDGAEALEAVRAGAFDLVLMDANMPNMDGATAVREIRGLGGPRATLPMYMLTANVFEDDLARYRASGADGVLKKPIDVRQLFGVLEAVAAGMMSEQPAA